MILFSLPDSNIKKTLKKKLYGSFYWFKSNCLKATQPLLGDSLLFTTKSPGVPDTSLDRPRKDERLSQAWSHPVVLNPDPSIGNQFNSRG